MREDIDPTFPTGELILYYSKIGLKQMRPLRPLVGIISKAVEYESKTRIYFSNLFGLFPDRVTINRKIKPRVIPSTDSINRSTIDNYFLGHENVIKHLEQNEQFRHHAKWIGNLTSSSRPTMQQYYIII